MKIKQLEWAGIPSTEMAATPFGAYRAGGGWWFFNLGTPEWVMPATMDAAKAACQADFERRVRECVEFEQ